MERFPMLTGEVTNQAGSTDVQLRIPVQTVVNSTDPGITGQICADANYLYICVATDTWKRVAWDVW